MAYNKLVVFDFDGTLFNTPDPEEGKKIWKNVTGEDWRHAGWWSRAESLDTDIFYIPMNMWVYRKYLSAKSDDKNYVMLATGRLDGKENMHQSVSKILDMNNLEFDEVRLCWGGGTFAFKTRLIGARIRELGVSEVVIYDDRPEQLKQFKGWATEQSIKVTIIDIVNKKEFIYN